MADQPDRTHVSFDEWDTFSPEKKALYSPQPGGRVFSLNAATTAPVELSPERKAINKKLDAMDAAQIQKLEDRRTFGNLSEQDVAKQKAGAQAAGFTPEEYLKMSPLDQHIATRVSKDPTKSSVGGLRSASEADRITQQAMTSRVAAAAASPAFKAKAAVEQGKVAAKDSAAAQKIRVAADQHAKDMVPVANKLRDTINAAEANRVQAFKNLEKPLPELGGFDSAKYATRGDQAAAEFYTRAELPVPAELVKNTAAGTPAAGTPAAGTPAAGTPAAGTPAAGTPALPTATAGDMAVAAYYKSRGLPVPNTGDPTAPEMTSAQFAAQSRAMRDFGGDPSRGTTGRVLDDGSRERILEEARLAMNQRNLKQFGTVAVDPRYAGPGQLTTDTERDASGKLVNVKAKGTREGVVSAEEFGPLSTESQSLAGSQKTAPKVAIGGIPTKYVQGDGTVVDMAAAGENPTGAKLASLQAGASFLGDAPLITGNLVPGSEAVLNPATINTQTTTAPSIWNHSNITPLMAAANQQDAANAQNTMVAANIAQLDRTLAESARTAPENPTSPASPVKPPTVVAVKSPPTPKPFNTGDAQAQAMFGGLNYPFLPKVGGVVADAAEAIVDRGWRKGLISNESSGSARKPETGYRDLPSVLDRSPEFSSAAPEKATAEKLSLEQEVERRRQEALGNAPEFSSAALDKAAAEKLSLERELARRRQEALKNGTTLATNP